MRWLKEWYHFLKHIKCTNEIAKFGSPWYHTVDNCHNAEKIMNHVCPQRHPQTGCISQSLFQHSGFRRGIMGIWERPITANNALQGFELHSDKGSPLPMFRQFRKIVQQEPCLSRDWLVQLWVAERRSGNSRFKRKQRVVRRVQRRETAFENQPLFQSPFRRWFASPTVAGERFNDSEKPLIKQPPLSQSSTDFLQPTSPEEIKVEPLLARANLLITRDIEWANLMLGFEQENRYAMVDACYPQSPVGFIREQSNLIFRQLLRTRRPFVAYITDAMGNELFRVRRPIWFINSTIYAEIDGKEIGVVHRRWHLWRRVYDLYLGKRQFAVVENPGFWNWTFTLKDSDGNVLAEIDRDWRGIGFELFTDAGQYVIRFGHADPISKTGPAHAIQELEISRPLTLSERAVAVALAVSLDNDYFSRHGGWGVPFIAVGE
ncbi:altered inheritance rate of mitochondria protein 25 [Magnolia sinica]|uniref:altered inheritance rate of mitochondria protein 25 n=1 Tax=Magnolia sinica TaxID=86752 RepID=UPI002659A2C6|nr:altered inheritance rate of mitochondria protein 25 [Magnolia sinica]XP_058085725.1 altered inheritance rate of mitochondria protein 25 [Magnolia sinica]